MDKGPTSRDKPTTLSDAATETKISRKEAETMSLRGRRSINWTCGKASCWLVVVILIAELGRRGLLGHLARKPRSRHFPIAAGVDSELVTSMCRIIKSAGDQASEVALEVQQLLSKLIKVGKGRQMIFMVLESFRTYDRLDLVFGGALAQVDLSWRQNDSRFQSAMA